MKQEVYSKKEWCKGAFSAHDDQEQICRGFKGNGVCVVAPRMGYSQWDRQSCSPPEGQ